MDNRPIHKPLGIGVVLAFFGLSVAAPRHNFAPSARRGRVYGGGSKHYGGPKVVDIHSRSMRLHAGGFGARWVSVPYARLRVRRPDPLALCRAANQRQAKGAAA